MYGWIFVAVIAISFFSISQISLAQSQIDDHLSPRMQILQGILPHDVSCKDGFELILKNSNSLPVCVKPETAERLVERNWGTKMSFVLPSEKVTEEHQTDLKRSPVSFEVLPASSGGILNLYVNDADLSTSPRGVDIVDTEGLIEITINGVEIEIPSTMVETYPGSGKFYLRVALPNSIDGKPLSQDDIVLIRYIDKTDSVGEMRVSTASFPLSKTYANLELSGGGNRIGHEFTLRIYEPDANLDSKRVDRIPLSLLEFRSGSIRTTLANPAFSANSGSLLETGPNTNIFEVKIKIPRSIGGQTIHIGDWYEIRYVDRSTPSGTAEKVVLKQRIGSYPN